MTNYFDGNKENNANYSLSCSSISTVTSNTSKTEKSSFNSSFDNAKNTPNFTKKHKISSLSSIAKKRIKEPVSATIFSSKTNELQSKQNIYEEADTLFFMQDIQQVVNSKEQNKFKSNKRLQKILKEVKMSMNNQIKKQFPSNRDNEKDKGDYAYEDTIENCNRIIERFSLQCVAHKDAFSSTKYLFDWIQKKGLLNAKILKYFSHHSGITNLTFTQSYGHLRCEMGKEEKIYINIPTAAKQSPRLCTVPLSGNGNFEFLKFLDINSTDIHDEELRYIIKLSNLIGLGLATTKITHKGLAYLSKHALFLERLKCLMIGDNPLLGNQTINFLSKFIQLEDLNISNTNITIDGVRKIGILHIKKISFKNLLHLRVSKCIEKFLKRGHVEFYRDTSLNNLQTSFESPAFLLQHMSRNQLIAHLRRFGSFYGNLPVNTNSLYLMTRLMEILEWRKGEEFIWSILDYC